jgi:hypothetical protein
MTRPNSLEIAALQTIVLTWTRTVSANTFANPQTNIIEKNKRRSQDSQHRVSSTDIGDGRVSAYRIAEFSSNVNRS